MNFWKELALPYFLVVFSPVVGKDLLQTSCLKWIWCKWASLGLALVLWKMAKINETDKTLKIMYVVVIMGIVLSLKKTDILCL
jgi:hypothetical protein